MGLSLDNLAVVTLVHQLNSIEAEALSIMGVLSDLRGQKTQLSNALLDSKSNMTAMAPAKSDYYYTVSTGTDTSTGITYSIDSRYQDYSAVSTNTTAGVQLRATKKVTGSTLKADTPTAVLKGGEFTGTVVNINDRSYSKGTKDDFTGYIGTVDIIDPTQYYVKTSETDDNGTTATKQAPADAKLEDLCDEDGNPITFEGNTYTLSELEGKAFAVSGTSEKGYHAGEKLTAGNGRQVYISKDSDIKIDNAKEYNMVESGSENFNDAYQNENLYVCDPNSNVCHKATEDDFKNPNGKKFIVKTGDVSTSTNLSGVYVDADNKSAPLTINGQSPMSFEDAVSNGQVPEKVAKDLIEAAMHAFSASMGYEADGETLCCSADYIRQNYDIVKTGDNEWGIVSKNIGTSNMASIYKIDPTGQYDEPTGNIPAHHLQFDASGNLVGFQVGDTENGTNRNIQLETQKVFDEEGYDKATKEYNSNLKASEIEQNNINKELNDLAQEDADMEARLTYLDSQKKTVEGFLEAAKSLAKSDAERLGKAFSG